MGLRLISIILLISSLLSRTNQCRALEPPGNPADGNPRRLTGHTAGVTSLAFGPDGDLLASGDQRGNILIWNTVSGDIRQRIVEDRPLTEVGLDIIPSTKHLLAFWATRVREFRPLDQR